MSDQTDDMELKLASQGIASYKVSDGDVFVFTTATLQKLLTSSLESGRVIVFVKAQIKN